jgi:hypothetical protein
MNCGPEWSVYSLLLTQAIMSFSAESERTAL